MSNDSEPSDYAAGWAAALDEVDRRIREQAGPSEPHVDALARTHGRPLHEMAASFREDGPKGEVLALAKVLSGATPEFADRAAENHMGQARRLLASDWLAARVQQAEACPVDGCSSVMRGQSCPRQVEAERDGVLHRLSGVRAENSHLADLLARAEAERDALRERVEALIAANARTSPGDGSATDRGIDAADRAWRHDLRAALDGFA